MVKAFTQSIHGDFICPDLLDILKNVDYVTAGRLVDGMPNSIYQITHHLISWGTWGVMGASGNPFIRTESEEELNFFPVDESPTEAQWEATKRSLIEFVKRFESALPGIDPTGSHLDWKSFNNSRAVLFAVAHTAYHTSQVVAILRMLKAYHRS